MKLHIPGTSININIGGKGKPSKKDVLDKAYKKVLSSGTDQSKVTWPGMEPGAPLWYDEDQQNLRSATAAGMMHQAEDAVPNGVKNYNLEVGPGDKYPGPMAGRAFSSSEGKVFVPGELEGYFSKPQYLATVLAHEVAHNNDWRRNHPTIGHSIETFRPLEKQTNASAQIEPQYDPGTDVGLGGANEYADRYASLGPYNPQYFLSANQMDPTKQIFPVDAKALAKEIINRRNIARSGPTNSGGYKNVPGSGRGFQI